jgi:hypothetical protein
MKGDRKMATTRSENIRELERALIGLDSEPGVKQHIERVLKTYTDVLEGLRQSAPENVEPSQLEIPESYVIIVGSLLNALDSIQAATDNITLARETM